MLHSSLRLPRITWLNWISLLSSQSHVLLCYTDGGPDHRVNYILVQLALIAIFRMLDLEFLCAACTAPCHSWRNPVERVISTFKQFCDAAKKTGFQEDAIDSVSHAKVC